TTTIGSSSKMGELLKSAEPLAQQFNSLHVEILADQAAELFERALRAREKISSLRVSSFQNLMDIWEFVHLDKIHSKEIELHRYDLPEIQAKAEQDAVTEMFKSAKSELDSIGEFLVWYAPGWAPNPPFTQPAGFGNRLQEAMFWTGTQITPW